jgi:hypothetical protein
MAPVLSKRSAIREFIQLRFAGYRMSGDVTSHASIWRALDVVADVRLDGADQDISYQTLYRRGRPLIASDPFPRCHADCATITTALSSPPTTTRPSSVNARTVHAQVNVKLNRFKARRVYSALHSH